MKKIDLSGALFFEIKIEKLRLGPLEIDALGKFPTAPARFKNELNCEKEIASIHEMCKLDFLFTI